MTVPPGSTIGIVGGGQLGRMLAVAAAQLGYKCHIYAPDEAPPAAEVSARFTRGDWTDEAALARFGGQIDVATYEFENIAAGPLAALAAEAPLFPPPRALAIAQDRLSEKQFVLGSRRLPRRIRCRRHAPGSGGRAGEDRHAGRAQDPALRL
jgi:5-(carboxyamino)imidazole ribonucleotide synthase